MKKLAILTMLLTVLILKSCSFDDSEMVYEEKLVVFASISANLPIIDTVLVSKTASINDESVLSSDLVVNDAQVRLIEDSTGKILDFFNVGPGQYFPVFEGATLEDFENYTAFIIQPGQTYSLFVGNDMDSVLAVTTVPEEMNIRAADLGTYTCPDGTELSTDTIDVNNLSQFSVDQLLGFASDPQSFISDYNINVDSITFRFGDCFTKSFASYPMFGVDFDSDNYQTIKTLTFALDANEKGLEPLIAIGDINAPSFEDPDSGMFYDYNYNGIRDSTFINLIYDTSFVNVIWKGPYLRDENNNPSRENPFVWSIERGPIRMSWLYFNYYGLQLITVQATDINFYNYLQGDPLENNIYTLPGSNIEGGYGLFSSHTYEKFYVYLKKGKEY